MGGNMIVSGSLDTNVKVWDLRGKKSMHTLKSHAKPITCVDISVDGRVIGTGSADSYIKIWEGGSGRNAQQLRHGHSSISQISINPVF
jgi:katanin p80 WD40 repeat-containing subunit B1